MKPYMGSDVEYRGYYIKNNKKDGFLEVYDKNGNYLFRQHNFNHGSFTDVKLKIDEMVKRYGY